MNFPVGVESWNAMQALLKCVGRELAGSFVALQGLASIGFMYFLALWLKQMEHEANNDASSFFGCGLPHPCFFNATSEDEALR